MVPLSKLLSKINVVTTVGNLNVPIRGLTDDSREVKDGYVFVCMSAVYESQYARWVYNTDGHNYISDAIRRGAAAIVSQKLLGAQGSVPLPSDRVTFVQVQDARRALAKMAAEFYGNPSRKLMVVGITGTNGKTSTCYLTRSVLAAGKLRTAVLGTISQRVAGSDVPAGMTTPEAHRIQSMLNDAVEEGLDSVVMEVSSHALELKRIEGTKFDVAVFTNLTQDHLDFHKDMAGYLAAKTKLFSGLMKRKKGQIHRCAPTVIINVDDKAGEHIIQHTDAEVITYGVHGEADLRICDFRSSVEGLTFRASILGSKELEVRLQLLGEYNLYNALAAIGVGISQGLDLDVIKEGLESVDLVPGRFERVDCGQNYTVVVDYAHTPDALERVLYAAGKLAEGKLVTVFGCGGDRDKAKRPLMGRVATKLSDYSIITSDNPRSEDPMDIIYQIQSGINGSRVAECEERQRYELIPDRRSAIRRAIDIAEEGDIVVIAGKGHETYQILRGGRIHFDDREVVCEFITGC